MIIKSNVVKKLDLNHYNLILLYGKNEGLKREIVEQLIEDEKEIFNYEEQEVLEINNNFLENLLNKSLFEKKKTIIIRRITDKIFKIIEKIYNSDIDDNLILIADNLEKKSKLRSFFEKEKKLVCIPVYPDDHLSLSKLFYKFVKEKKISISQSDINQILFKTFGDREKLLNELTKIEHFTKNGKKLTERNLAKLINLSENYSIAELIDNCLAKNTQKTIKILSENNYTNEDCMLIIRTLLNKSKRILKLVTEYRINKNVDLTISNAKPPIFWKDKQITKQQIEKWGPSSLKLLVYKINEIEISIKKNLNNSLNIVTDFLLHQSKTKTNN